MKKQLQKYTNSTEVENCLQCFDAVVRWQEGHLACKNWVV